MNAVALDDIDAAQLRKLTHARATVRRKPWTPALGRIDFGPRCDRERSIQYHADFVLNERLRLTCSQLLWHLHAPAGERVARNQLFIHRPCEHRPCCANPYSGDRTRSPV